MKGKIKMKEVQGKSLVTHAIAKKKGNSPYKKTNRKIKGSCEIKYKRNRDFKQSMECE